MLRNRKIAFGFKPNLHHFGLGLKGGGCTILVRALRGSYIVTQ